MFIHLDGGFDGNALLIPTDASRFADYTRVRPTNGAAGLELSKLLTFTAASGERYGLHPSATGLHSLLQSGQAAFVANTGPLRSPTTRDEARAGANLPRSLFSHSDQVNLWQTLDHQQAGRTGLGGRLGDWATQTFGRGRIPAVISFSPAAGPFVAGIQDVPVVTSPTSQLSLCGYHLCGEGPWTSLVHALGRKELALDTRSRSLRAAAAEDLAGSLALSSEVSGVLQTRSSLDSLFTGNWQHSDIAHGLLRVAKLMEQRGRFGLKRQVFVVGLGGWDMHQGQDWPFNNQMEQVSNSIAAFQLALRSMGIHNNVVTATISDFGRTFRTNNNWGTDHGWGNHMFVVGPQVTGGAVFGRYPQLQLGGPDDFATEGRWVPTLSSDQYFATLASWFGVPDAVLPSIVPNIGSFSLKNLGFLRNA